MVYVTFECAPEFKERLELLAREEQRSVSAQIRKMLLAQLAVDPQAGAVIERGFVKSVTSELVESPSESQSEAQAKPEDHKNERKRHHRRK